jgi:hypothetical protein
LWKEHSGVRFESDDEVANRRTASLGGLAITLFLAVLGLFLLRGLQAPNTMGDCLNSGQINCHQGSNDITIFSTVSDLITATKQSVRQPNS